MQGRVLYGTSFGELQRQAFEWLDKQAGPTPESAVLLEQNDYQRERMAAAWRAEYDPLRLAVSELARFGQTAHERLFGPYPDIGTVERRRLIEQALRTADTPEAIDAPRQHTESISELFRELEADGLQTRSQLETRLRETDCSNTQRELLTAVYEQYQRLGDDLTHPDAMPRNEKLAAVAGSDDDLEEAFPHLDAVVVSGLHDPAAVEAELLERLAEAVPVLVLVPTTTPDTPSGAVNAGVAGIVEMADRLGFETDTLPDETNTTEPLAAAARRLYQPGPERPVPSEQLSWHEAPTPDREITHLARRLRDRLATADVDPNDVLVLAPGLLSYRDGLADTFDAYGIEHSYRVSVLLERTYVGQAVLDALRLCERPNTTQISNLGTNPLVSIPDIDPTEVTDTHRRLYTTATDPFVAELDESAAGVETLLARAEAVRTATPTELRPAIDSLFEHLGIGDAIDSFEPDAGIDIGYEARAFSRIERILDSVERVCEALAPTDPLSEATGALEGVRVSPPPQGSDGRVEIVGLQDTPMADFEELYVLGATAEQLSGRETRPRFFRELGEELELFELTQRDVTRYRFGVLVANADRVHITTPETTLEDESLLVSPLVDELSRVTGLEPTSGVENERRGSREDLQRAMAGAGPERLRPALTDAKGNGHVTERFVTTAARGAACASHRAEDGLSKHDGQLSPAAMANLAGKLDARPFSHSRMSSYAKCGFKYMLTEGWGFEEDDDIEPGVSPLVIGSIVHSTVEAFYTAVQDGVDDEPVDLTAFDRTELEEMLLEAGMAAVEDADERFVDTFRKATLYRLFSGLATPTANDYYAPEGTANPPDGTFALFLDAERARAADGHRPTAFEEAFGADGGVSIDTGRQLPVHGVIDRIDETAAGGVTILDYKSSSVGNTRGRENDVRDGLDFQLPTYALGTPSLFSERSDLSATDVAARYYILNADPEVKLRRSLADRFDVEYGTFLTETVPDRIADLTGAIDAGAFQPAVVGADAANCEYCAFSDVCDVRHHRRYDVIEAIDEADASAYVPDGARPGDIESRLPGGETDE
jgi:ATP-dependent helicase/nuclease subunit B